MPFHPKTGSQQFDSEWQKAVSWAQSQGIGPNSYLPVYQMDLQRMATGQYPMGAAERNLAILAAHNPNQVSSAPQDNPQGSLDPKTLMGNVVSDVGKIATGIEGIFTGSFERQVWDSAKTTFHAVVDPASMDSGSFGGTIGNWLNDTLLSYLPGAADIGTILQKDPSLTGSAGMDALLQHPLISALDVMPGGGGLLERFGGKLGLGEVAAARGGIVGSAAQKIGGITAGGKPGVTMAGQLVEKMSVKDRLEKMAARLGPGGSGVGPSIGNLAEAIGEAGAMSTEMYAWLLDAPTQALKALSDQDVATLKKVLDTRRTSGGDSVREALKDPAFSPAAKDVLQMWLNGPLRFATENELFSGNLRPVRSLNGDVGMWAVAGKSARTVLGAGNVRRAAQRGALKALDELQPHVDRVEALDAMRARSVGEFGQRLAAARRQVFDDPALQRPLTRDVGAHQDLLGRTKAGGSRFRAKASISRVDQLHAVVGEGGIADKFLEQVGKSSDPDQIEELAKAMKERLRAWGPQSVKAAEHPALQKLYETADAFQQWAKKMRQEQGEIDKAIHGTVESRKHFLQETIDYRRQGLQQLKDRHTRERDQLTKGYQRGKAQRSAKFAKTVRDAGESKTWRIEAIEREAELAAARATRNVLDTEIMPKVRERVRAVNEDVSARIRTGKLALSRQNKLAWTEYQRDSSRLARKHYTELTRAKKLINQERAGMGEMLAEAVRYGNAVKAFQQAVMDHPADQYRDAFVALIQKHILDAEETSALTIATDKYLRDLPKMTDRRLAQIRSNPEIVAELTMAHFTEIMNQPDLEPEVAEDARAEMDQFRSDAHEELKLLIGQGFRVPYIPVATSFDERLGRDSMAPVIGHGIPKPDMAKARVWDLTPHKDDFALGINKAVVQTLQRDATIYLAEHYLKPLALTKQQVDEFMWVFKKPEELAAGGNVAHELQHLQAEDLGLEKFDPKSLFGFTLPRWSKADAMYLPKPVVNALREFEKQRRRSLLGASNKVFRYSILGLSPRYTAHIVFGGSMMLAMRSSPLVFTLIPDAVKALRDGTVPSSISRHAVEEGFEEPINMVQRQMGRDMINGLAVPEHIETVQKVKMAAAKPIHVLRALADINFRFTRYVRDLQAAVAYLDGAAKVTRRDGKVEIEDPETGNMIKVSSERAVKEGVHHVQEVFGNLRRMSPVERQIAQSVMPFYGWQKHILGYIMSFPFDHPYRAMVLSQLAFNASQAVPLAYPIRLQLLYFLGSPDAQGNVNAVDIRSLDPFRDVANYATWAGVFESLNPALEAPMAMAFGSQAVYGSSSLYPSVTYNAFYGIRTSASGGSWVNGLEQWVPQVGAVVSAAQAAGGLRSEWQTNRSSAIKQMLEAMNIPFVTPPVNLKQLAAKDQDARFETAKAAAYTAFSSGDFSGLAGYKTVPNPLNDAYEITPAQLETLYRQAQQQYPGVAPIESLLPPPTPYGF